MMDSSTQKRGKDGWCCSIDQRETEKERWGDRGDDDGQSKEGGEVRSLVDGGEGDWQEEDEMRGRWGFSCSEEKMRRWLYTERKENEFCLNFGPATLNL